MARIACFRQPENVAGSSIGPAIREFPYARPARRRGRGILAPQRDAGFREQMSLGVPCAGRVPGLALFALFPGASRGPIPQSLTQRYGLLPGGREVLLPQGFGSTRTCILAENLYRRLLPGNTGQSDRGRLCAGRCWVVVAGRCRRGPGLRAPALPSISSLLSPSPPTSASLFPSALRHRL
jgi:hypothetical protein